ncbi:hypothetical protein ACFFX0_15435 [Citricoccus parietis]|uniref:Uncharacterized protein n=1 Tax=Citricoccus parietis TaxID=592307 RepID=A0ABV5G0Q1_9MICC
MVSCSCRHPSPVIPPAPRRSSDSGPAVAPVSFHLDRIRSHVTLNTPGVLPAWRTPLRTERSIPEDRAGAGTLCPGPSPVFFDVSRPDAFSVSPPS